MRKIALTLMTSLLSCSAASAFWPEAADSLLEVGVGYRQDTIEWKTRSHFDSSSCATSYDSCDEYLSEFPGVNSKLKWKDLSIWQIEMKGKYVTCDNVYLRMNADYGWVTSGKNHDSDRFHFDSSHDHYVSKDCHPSDCSDYDCSRSHAKAKGDVYDVRLAVGYQFKMCDDNFSVAPLIGYSWHGQHLKDKRQHDHSSCYTSSSSCDIVPSSCHTVSKDDCSSDSSYCGKHTKYNTRWNGPFIGFDFDYRFGCACEWDFFGTYEFHWADYHARGHWAQRPDLPDGFRHHAKTAYGSIFDIGVRWDFCECWTLAVKGEFQWFWADKGRDRARIGECHAGNVKEECVLSIPLRDIKWNSAGVSVDVGMVF